jgi:hypothetical protein
MLLKRSELGVIVGDTDMKETLSYTTQQTTQDVDPPSCTSRMLAGNASGYEIRTMLGMTGSDNSGSAGTLVSQVVAVFAADAAAGMMYQVAQEWGADCPGEAPMTVSAGQISQTWTAGSLDPPTGPRTDAAKIGRLTTVTRRAGAEPRACGHVITRQDRVVVETMVCGPDDRVIAQAGTIADQILAKLP